MLADTDNQNKLQMLRAPVRTVHDNITGHGMTWTASLQKTAASLRNMEQHLITENEGEDLSVTAQMMLEQSVQRAIGMTEECMRQHKEIHNSISKIGKVIDKQLIKDIGSFSSREKDLETNETNQEATCSLIFDFLMGEGMFDAAISLKEEANLKDKESVEYVEAIRNILNDLKQHDVTSSLNYLMEMAPHELKLRYDLEKQKTLRLIADGNEKEAMKCLKNLRFLGNDQETPRIMGAVLRGTASVNDSRYKSLYAEAVWADLAHRMADIMSSVKSDLVEVVDTGRRTLSVLHGLKRTFSRGHLLIEEELPVEIKVKRQIHSTFTCPILKEQSSERNPPMKLLCGHVISRDAMQRLSANRLVNPRAQMPRPARLKCPYCPREQGFEAARQVLFSHVQL